MQEHIIIAEIRSELPKLKKEFGVNRIGLFGSYAKDRQSHESDLDFLVDLDPPYAKHYFGLLFFLEKKFDKKIDLVRRGPHLRRQFIQSVENEIMYA